MLVLNRFRGEKIVIGDGPGAITVEVREIDRGKVSLAIEAPREVLILRKELADRAALHRAARGEGGAP